MGHHATARELHGAHEDERNRVALMERQVALMERHEQAVREREHLRVVAAVAAPMPHAFRTPIVHAYDHNAVVGAMLVAGEVDDTGFSDGAV